MTEVRYRLGYELMECRTAARWKEDGAGLGGFSRANCKYEVMPNVVLHKVRCILLSDTTQCVVFQLAGIAKGG
jgi:hypothetical protein